MRTHNNKPDIGNLRTCPDCWYTYHSHASGKIYQICPRCKQPMLPDELLREARHFTRAASNRLRAMYDMIGQVNEPDEFMVSENGPSIDHEAAFEIIKMMREDLDRTWDRLALLDGLYTEDYVELDRLIEVLKTNLEKAQSKKRQRVQESEVDATNVESQG